MNLCIVKHVRTPKHSSTSKHTTIYFLFSGPPGPRGNRRVDTVSTIPFLVIKLLHEKGPTSPQKPGSGRQTATLRPAVPPSRGPASSPTSTTSASRYEVSLGSVSVVRTWRPDRETCHPDSRPRVMLLLQMFPVCSRGGERGSAGELGLQLSTVSAGSCRLRGEQGWTNRSFQTFSCIRQMEH